MKHLNIKIFGFVQGVNFRFFVEQKASELGIKGFVRNEPDGTVYVEAEAPDETLNKFVEFCKRGPTFAGVENTEIKESKFEHFSTFEIIG
ncbi:hypothetical protein A3F07_01575 [candidate division WWE3 bacterium RIFCSPHIGHO2_12_FULL_38_15]|uniref:acylphosphatase n=1 Tax=candidate division WWE3 bacterium RIFCSPHIGHO2_02_FULL_38_14 TaxID=1802620 RepID=A0A1F4V8Z2_UNCKA|nr:MAG: hypothetical protein A2793_01725 [candidate division WWE3 bacterium RIFCSPHIGHO2_01_FULL_38_45]OGC48395.1 MAG: hypothetical protein A3F07_01575 [candidate division WWE3 bacterium RIFCSPHIGHO2_12_FULL_38_15]OGC53629.1 MAG: hypothetical protein A3D91_04280 [candidate division WWE3 bacterium RIFCSPHIGHO2_02_FULL_38_14]OGC54329.1 MAG: hypothetical protein A3B64_02370 [candidate division WWE3 bacterium RIFCSPLOWO2_01_FULL_37_24]HLB51573.1 acylphosphatase [Patescibacteria group bacterium]